MYDVLVLGGGPGGYKIAELLAKNGKSVAIVEAEKIGGTCLNKGCIPLKSLLHISKSYYNMVELQTDGIIKKSQIDISPIEIKNKKDKIVSDIRKGLEYTIKSLGIHIYSNWGYIIGKNEFGIIQIKLDNDTIIESEKLIIATGSRSIWLNYAEQIYSYDIFDSDGFLNYEKVPQNVLIIGAGVIGLEIASFYSMLGKNVVVVDNASTIGAKIDIEISESLKNSLEKRGIVFYLNTKVEEFEKNRVLLSNERDGIFELCPEAVCIAIGRKPNVCGYGIENLGINFDERGYIVTDKNGETTEKNVFACGDVIGGLMLAHAAYNEANIVADYILNKERKRDCQAIPGIIYTSPEVASVGMTEEDCLKKGIAYKKVVKSMMYNGRYYLEHGRDYSMIKLLIDEEQETILGAHMVGDASSEIIVLLESFIVNQVSIENVKKIVFPHPTVCEIILDVLEEYKCH